MSPKRFPGLPVDPAPLGQPLQFHFSGRTAPNRFLKGAMSELLSSWDSKDTAKSGLPSKELVNVYRRWGEGGLGMIITGNFMLYYDQLVAPGNPIIARDAPFGDARFEIFKDLATQSKLHGSLIIAQLCHPGRQVPESINPHPISASDVQLEGTALGTTYGKPKTMNKTEIKDLVDRFAYAAEYLHKAGYDGIQIHAAHGYLLAQFLSQTTNKRTDEYGGPLLNRARIIFDIVTEIRRRVTDASFMIGIKLNSVEFQHGGFTPEECRDLCVELEKQRVDFVELSGGTYQELGWLHRRESTRKREAFFLEFAEMIVPLLKHTKVYVTGGLRTAAAMVGALNSVHGIGLGRPLTHEFDLGKKLLEGRVQSAIDYGLDEQDFGITSDAAGVQIRLVGRDKEPLDMGRSNHQEAFVNARRRFLNDVEIKDGGSQFEVMDIDGVKLQPYGTPYEAVSASVRKRDSKL